MDRIINAKVCVMNCTNELKTGFMVARLVNATLWYYGLYNTMERAAEVAVELGNGVILGIYNGEESRKEQE